MSDPPKRLGRPPIDPDDPSTQVSIRIPSKQFDALYSRAAHERMSVSDFVRTVIRDELEKDPRRP